MKSNNDDRHGHGQEKGKPSTYVDEETNIFEPSFRFLLCGDIGTASSAIVYAINGLEEAWETNLHFDMLLDFGYKGGSSETTPFTLPRAMGYLRIWRAARRKLETCRAVVSEREIAFLL